MTEEGAIKSLLSSNKGRTVPLPHDHACVQKLNGNWTLMARGNLATVLKYPAGELPDDHVYHLLPTDSLGDIRIYRQSGGDWERVTSQEAGGTTSGRRTR